MTMTTPQPRLLAPTPASARFLTFALAPSSSAAAAFAALARMAPDADVVVGLGPPLLARVPPFPRDLTRFPATQHALWLALYHADSGAQLDKALGILRALGDAFLLVEEIQAFTYRGGRDLSGFVDGTENPSGDAAHRAALTSAGGSYALVQRWIHDLPTLARMEPSARDHVIGRRFDDDEELPDAPVHAHIKRTVQEDLGFVVRRSMPYGTVHEHGLYFVAYAQDTDRFVRMLARMAGKDDGVEDGLFAFTRAVTGGFYFCPPLVDGRIDLR